MCVGVCVLKSFDATDFRKWKLYCHFQLKCLNSKTLTKYTNKKKQHLNEILTLFMSNKTCLRWRFDHLIIRFTETEIGISIKVFNFKGCPVKRGICAISMIIYSNVVIHVFHPIPWHNINYLYCRVRNKWSNEFLNYSGPFDFQGNGCGHGGDGGQQQLAFAVMWHCFDTRVYNN